MLAVLIIVLNGCSNAHMNRKTIFAALPLTVALGFFTFGAARSLVQDHQQITVDSIQLKSRQSDLTELDIKYTQLNEDLGKAAQKQGDNKQQIDKLNKEKSDLDKQKQQLQEQLQSKATEKSSINVASNKVLDTVTGTQVVSADADSEQEAKVWIYTHESSNNPNSIASNGACGLGQALPCSKLPCAMGDYTCQDTWFTAYMKDRYGTWVNAKSEWISRATYYNGDYHQGWW